LKSKIGFVTQDDVLFPHLTGHKFQALTSSLP
jgi:ABC-type sulfate/molybdate transport systems ATPase subunit